MYNNKKYIASYLKEVKQICDALDQDKILKFANLLNDLKGRCFILGVGGSAANASHLVNDLRKICKIDALTPLDNISELTARINDDSWDTSLSETLKISNLNENDCIIILSVGGGSNHTSKNLVEAMNLAKQQGTKILSIVSRDGGTAKILSDVCILIPTIQEKRITAHAEEFQGVLWHLIVNLIEECC